MTATSDLAIVQVPIGDLLGDPANPRRISDAEIDTLTMSLCVDGFVLSVLARAADKTVIGGHSTSSSL